MKIVRFVLPLAAVALVVCACTTTKQTAPPAGRPAASEEQHDDTTWLTDEQGRSYYIMEVPRVEGRYLIIDSTHVRIQNGLTLEFVRYDDEFFYAKVYRVPEPQKEIPSAPVDPAIAQSYIPETKEDDLWEVKRVESGLPREGQWRNGFAVGDINGDGFLDIVSGPPRRSVRRVPRIWLNDGQGQFKSPVGVFVQAAPYDYGDAEIGDFDGDGWADLALAAHMGDVVVLMAQNDGSYRLEELPLPATPSGKAAGFSSRTLAVGDWNSDGRPDLLALSEGPAMRVSRAEAGSYSGGKVLYIRDSDGTWKARASEFPDQTFGDAIVVADFNGDNRLDFAASTSSLGDRSILNIHQPDGSWAIEDLVQLRPGSIVRSLSAIDVNGDDRSDLAIGYQAFEGERWRSGVDLFVAGDDTWRRRTLWSEEGRAGVFALAAGDLDGDGQIDLAAATGDGRLLPFRRTGEGFVRERPVAAAEVGCRGYDLEIADLDQDGNGELVAEFAGEKCPGGGEFQTWEVTRKNR